jgi:hypothetical protein
VPRCEGVTPAAHALNHGGEPGFSEAEYFAFIERADLNLRRGAVGVARAGGDVELVRRASGNHRQRPVSRPGGRHVAGKISIEESEDRTLQPVGAGIVIRRSPADDDAQAILE